MVPLQNNLSWQNHIHWLKTKLSPIISVMFKLRHKLNKRAKLMIFELLMQSRIHCFIININLLKKWFEIPSSY